MMFLSMRKPTNKNPKAQGWASSFGEVIVWAKPTDYSDIVTGLVGDVKR